LSDNNAASADRDHTLAYLREQFALGNTDEARNALLRLSPQGRSEIEARLGSAAVARMYLATRRVRGALLGRVVVIHGIMGGRLASVNATGDEDLVWVNYLRLVAGRISDFALDSNGESLDPSISIVTKGLLDEYMPLVFELSRRWRVLPFAFDWRLDIDNSAAVLNREISQWANGEPVHIVAHSMGGLVSRRFMQKFPETWQAMKDPFDLKRGGRLIMLGTPNKGSFAISFVLTGQEKLLKKLALFDLKHDMKELLETVNTFPGSYQMLPSPRLNPGDDRLRLFDAATWGGFPVPRKYLELGRRFQEEMDQVQDPDRLVYVAGYNQPTPSRIRIDGPGNFSYQETLDGDGRVPHELGLLPGVPSFFVEEAHGDLPSNEQVLAGIHDLLATGSTAQMPSTRPVARTTRQVPQWRTADEISPMPTPIPSKRGAIRSLAKESAAAVESDLLDSFVGGARGTRTRAPGLADPVNRSHAMNARGAPAPAVHAVIIEVVWGDIAKVNGDVLAVGHYQSVEPQAGELALDRAISGVAPGDHTNPDALVITSHTRRGILRGAVGDINFFPWLKARKVVAVAGMGHPGTFGIVALQRTARALAESVFALPDVQTVCTLLIGSGNGNLTIPLALKTMLDGVQDALRSGLQVPSLRRIRIVERELHKAQVIAEVLKTLPGIEGLHVLQGVQRGPGGVIGEQIAVSAILLAAASRLKGNTAAARKAAAALLQGVDATPELQRTCEEFLRDLPLQADDDLLRQAGSLGFGRLPRWGGTNGRSPTRISFIQDSGGAGIRVAAISDTAVVAERLLPVDWSVVEEIVRKTTDPSDFNALPEVSQLMTRLFVPRDFREKIDIGDSLIVELDRATAPIHWEMLESFYDATSDNPLALTKPMARQLRTSYSPIPPRPYEPKAKLRALVIGDPGDPDKGLSLEGARIEALEVAAMLRGLGVEVDPLIGAENVPREGPLLAVAPATKYEMLRLLNSHDYDILHYAGHGDFNPEHPERAGWLFGDIAFTGHEIVSLSRAPTLVVANACLSALTSNIRSDSERPGPRGLDQALLPTLVDEFFMCGVRNYIGTAWEVSDAGAVLFSQKLYETLLPNLPGMQPATLGAALLAARRHLRAEERAYGALWAAYQHYGDPELVLRMQSATEGRTQSGEDPRDTKSLRRDPRRPARKRR